MRRSNPDWVNVPLGDVCEFKYGKSLPDLVRARGKAPVFGSNGQVGWHNEAITDGPTIVIGRKGSFGEVRFSHVACWPIDTTYYVDRSATKADLRWLSYRLASLGLNRLNRAAAVPGLNREDAYRQRLLLPPLHEQERIADILDKADALRAKRRAALAQVDTLAQSIFLEMFGDPYWIGWNIARVRDLAANADGAIRTGPWSMRDRSCGCRQSYQYETSMLHYSRQNEMHP
jgi:type I restriction enzyme, S subunit